MTMHALIRAGGRLGLLLCTVLATILLGLVGTATASASGPLLSLTSASNTTVANGADLNYFVSLANAGDAATDGSEIVLLIALPDHLTAVSATPFGGGLSCTAQDGSPLEGASTVRCTTTDVIFANALESVVLTVHVDSGAPGVITSSFEATGGGSPPDATVDPTRVAPMPLGFGVDAFDTALTADTVGAPLTQAGGHPYAYTTEIDFNTTTNPDLVSTTPEYTPFTGDLWPVEPVKDILVDLPPGLIGDPSSMTQCTAADLANSESFNGRPLCAPSSQVGIMFGHLNFFGQYGQGSAPTPVFNMVPPPGVPARFGVNINASVVVFDAQLRSSGDYGVSVNARNVPEGVALTGSTITFWGVPADPSHDAQRLCPPDVPSPCSAGVPPQAFFRNSTACPDAGGLRTALHIDSWVNPAPFNAEGTPNLEGPNWQSQSFASHLPPGYPADPGPEQENWGAITGPTGCESVPFEPGFSARPTSNQADSPTGLEVDLTMPQHGLTEPEVIAESDLRKATVTLPAGMAVNPSSANGLDACSPAQVGLRTEVGETPIHFTGLPAQCPDAAKIGTAEIATPLLDHPVEGAVYLAKQSQNPFGSLLAIYLAFDDPQSGTVIKLAGRVQADPQTGQLVTSFDENPQLPFEALHLELFGGPRASLINPPTCGPHTATATLTPWSGGEEARLSSSFTLGANCVNREAEARFNPGFEAGTVNPLAGATAPFVLHLTRTDGEQRLASLDTTAPEGVSAYLAGVPYCPDAALAIAKVASLTGAVELSSPSCPAASQLGTLDSGAGAGTNPFHVPGKAYLAGPYQGAPLSFAFFVPALAGPFDLGDVLVRAPVQVNPETAQVTVRSGALPTILAGIPLDLRSLSVGLNRPNFTLNPTSCDPSSVNATARSTLGATADLSSRFQVGNCNRLAFKPKLSLRLKGATARRGHPALRATLRMKAGQANIARAAVTLPPALILDQSHIDTVCTRVQYTADGGGGEQCPPGSLLGHARATTPLLDQPLEGPVYLRSSSHQLPDLVASLNGQIHVDLVGRIDSSKAGGLRTTFDTVPDTPVAKFTLTMAGGKKGLLQNSTNLCRSTNRATAKFDGQNGKISDSSPVVKADCGGKAKKKGGRR